jgi:glycosyltransferase involved in cell wall biosynthesis
MTKKDPILIFVYQTNPFVDGQGGGVRYVRQLAAAIEQKGAHIVFFGAGGRAETRGNIRYIPVVQSSDKTLQFMLKCLWARWRYIGRREAIVHVHRLYFALPFLGHSIKCLATLHGRTFSVFPQRFGPSLSRIVFPLFKFIEGWLLSRVNRIVAVSTDVSEQFQARHGGQVLASGLVVIPSMVDLLAFRPDESHYFSDRLGNHPVCLFVGRLAEVKNLPLLLDAWSIVAQRNPDARLAIAGDGELRDKLKSWIAQMDSAPSVVMLGQIGPTVIADVISGAKVLLLTSHHEASPTVVKEALSCGIPVVSTHVGDVASVIDDGHTGRITTADPVNFADAITEVLGWGATKEEIAMAAQPVLERCAPHQVADQYLIIYRDLGYVVKPTTSPARH